jgi:integrase
MFDHQHTSDNPHLSKPLIAAVTAQNGLGAVSCTERDTARLELLIAASVSDNTKRAYMADLAHFTASGGRLPATPEMVALYLSRFSQELSVATLSRRIATLSKIHKANGWPNPCQSEILRAAMQGLKRLEGAAQKQAKPLGREDLFLVLDVLAQTRRDTRDRALLLIGFAGGFRRSELVGLNWSDIEEVLDGVIITLRFSKPTRRAKAAR